MTRDKFVNLYDFGYKYEVMAEYDRITAELETARKLAGTAALAMEKAQELAEAEARKVEALREALEAMLSVPVTMDECHCSVCDKARAALASTADTDTQGVEGGAIE